MNKVSALLSAAMLFFISTVSLANCENNSECALGQICLHSMTGSTCQAGTCSNPTNCTDDANCCGGYHCQRTMTGSTCVEKS